MAVFSHPSDYILKEFHMSAVSFHDLSKLNTEGRNALFKRSETDLSSFVEKVGPIIEAVKTDGDAALIRFARELDKADVKPGNLKATEEEVDRAFSLVDKDVIEAIEFGIQNIRHFHEEQKPEAMWMKEMRPVPLPVIAIRQSSLLRFMCRVAKALSRR